MTSQSPHCANCGAVLDGQFCSHCGQRRIERRLGVTAVVGKALSDLFTLESALPRTVVELLSDPGGVAQRYIDGQRVRYVSPARYFFVALGLSILVRAALGISLLPANLQEVTPTDDGDRALALAQQVGAFVEANLNLLLAVALPVAGIALTVLFGGWAALLSKRADRRNYAEVMTLLFFVAGELYLIGLLLMPLSSIAPSLYLPVRLVCQVVLLSWAAWTFFSLRGVTGLAKALLANIAYFLALVLTITGISIPAVLLAG